MIGWFIVGGKHQLRLYFVMAVLVFFSCSCWIHLVVGDSTSPPLSVYKIYISIVQNVQLWGSTEGLTHDRVNHWNLMHVVSLMWPRGHYYCLNSVFFVVASLDLLVYLNNHLKPKIYIIYESEVITFLLKWSDFVFRWQITMSILLSSHIFNELENQQDIVYSCILCFIWPRWNVWTFACWFLG